LGNSAGGGGLFLADSRRFMARISAENKSLIETNLRKSAFHLRKSARKKKMAMQ
jgi:hypothetical protein